MRSSLEAGVHIKSVEECLGHATAAFTLDRYGQAATTMRQQAAELIDAAFRRLASPKLEHLVRVGSPLYGPVRA